MSGREKDLGVSRAAESGSAKSRGEGRQLLPPERRERPSRHGAILGEALARLSDSVPGALNDCCATCAFRRGCMTNQMASTGLVALKCAIGVDPDPFGCHHGMKDGEPTRACAGWLACKLADFSTIKEVGAWLTASLAEVPEGAPDPIRDAFDAWIAEVDPNNSLDDYERGRLYLRSALANEASPPSAELGATAIGLRREDP